MYQQTIPDGLEQKKNILRAALQFVEEGYSLNEFQMLGVQDWIIVTYINPSFTPFLLENPEIKLQ